MPHFIAEYSKNIESKINFDSLFKSVIDTMLETEMFPLGGIRCRAFSASHYRISTGDEKFGYIHMVLKIGSGRESDAKKQAADKIFETIKTELSELYDNNAVGISFEVVELDSILNYRHNNIHEYLKEQGK